MKDKILKIFTLASVIGILVYSFLFVSHGFDFTAFITAGRILRGEDRVNLYQVSVQEKYQNLISDRDDLILYRNPPTLAIFFVPLSYFDLETAYKINVVFGILFLFFAAWKIHKYFILDLTKVILFLVVFMQGTISILIGQSSFLFLTLLMFVSDQFRKGKSGNTGFLMGFFFNKPQYLSFFPFLLIIEKKRKELVKGFVLSIILQLAVSYLIVGAGGVGEYISFIKQTENIQFSSDPFSQISFFALLHYLGGVITMIKGNELFIDLVFYFLTIVCFFRLRRLKDKEQLFLSGILFTLFFSPHLWDYDLVLMIPAFFFLLKTAQKNNQKSLFLVAFILYFSWILRFMGFHYLISLVLLLGAITLIRFSGYQLNYQKKT